jgi:glycosyltransferase involved in cell wall biosynthesis
MTDDPAIHKMRANAVEFAAEQYSLEAMGRALRDLYNAIIKRSAANAIP